MSTNISNGHSYLDTPTWTPTSMEAWHSTDWSKIGLRSSSIMTSFDDCETDGLSSSSCIYNLFYYIYIPPYEKVVHI